MIRLIASCRRIRAIVIKELLVLLGNRVSRMMLIVPPFIQIFAFGYAATLEVRNIHIGILNSDSGSCSREIINRISGSPSFTDIILLASQGELKEAVDTQQVLLALVFDQDFSRQIERGNPAQLQAIMDGRRSNSAQLAAAYVSAIVNKFAQEKPEQNRSAYDSRNIGINTRFWFNPNLDFQWFFLPNLIGIISLMVGLIVTGLSVAREREMGTFSQLLVSPAALAEIAMGKLVPGCIVGLIQGTLFWLIARLIFGVPFAGSLCLFWISLLAFSLAASALGPMISSLCRTQQQAFLGAFTVGVPCILISGAVTPLLNMPQFLQGLSQLNPLRHFIIINLGLFLKDMTPASAILNLVKILLLALLFIAVAVWMFRRRT